MVKKSEEMLQELERDIDFKNREIVKKLLEEIFSQIKRRKEWIKLREAQIENLNLLKQDLLEAYDNNELTEVFLDKANAAVNLAKESKDNRVKFYHK